MVERVKEGTVRPKKLAVVIPSYNAAKTVGQVITKLPKAVDLIVVVDDGSSDETEDVIRKLANPRLVFVRHKENCGVGAAMLSGYREALKRGATVVAKMDADDQMDPRFLPRLVEPIFQGRADYVKGNRFLHLRDLRQMPWLRRIGNFFLSLLTKLASGYWNIFDPTNGYTAIHSALIPLLLEGRISRGFFFESSVLIELGLHRAVVKDVYIPARYPGGGSHLSELRAVISFPPRLLYGFGRRLWVQYIVRDFGIVSLLGFLGASLLLSGLAFGGYHWYQSSLAARTTPTGTVMIAALLVIFGVQSLFQALLLDVQNVPREPIHPDLATPASAYE